jgi:hypothetical protein
VRRIGRVLRLFIIATLIIVFMIFLRVIKK